MSDDCQDPMSEEDALAVLGIDDLLELPKGEVVEVIEGTQLRLVEILHDLFAELENQDKRVARVEVGSALLTHFLDMGPSLLGPRKSDDDPRKLGDLWGADVYLSTALEDSELRVLPEPQLTGEARTTVSF